jgi:pathogenesis-related protein 1
MMSVTKLLAQSIAIAFLLAGGSGRLPAQEAERFPNSKLDAATIKEMLQSHNQARLQRQIPPLTWSPRLETAAQEWAEHLSAIGAMQHDRSRRVGQNLFVSYGRQMPPAFVVGKWVEESKDYDERRFKCAHGEVCGHFTQVIWRGTKEVGCGVAGGANGQFWVCFYSPQGNIIGYKPY